MYSALLLCSQGRSMKNYIALLKYINQTVNDAPNIHFTVYSAINFNRGGKILLLLFPQFTIG